MNIGKAAKLSGLSVKIVRHGVDIGIINPNVEGTQVTGIFQNLI